MIEGVSVIHLDAGDADAWCRSAVRFLPPPDADNTHISSQCRETCYGCHFSVTDLIFLLFIHPSIQSRWNSRE